MKTRKIMFDCYRVAEKEIETIPDKLEKLMARGTLEFGVLKLMDGDLDLAYKILATIKNKILTAIK